MERATDRLALDPSITADPSAHPSPELVRACPYCTPKAAPPTPTQGGAVGGVDARTFVEALARMVRPSVVRVHEGRPLKGPRYLSTPTTGSRGPR